MHRLKDLGVGADVMFADGQLGHVNTRGDHPARLYEQAPAIVAIPVQRRNPP
jgi:hypothetical protein